MQTVEYATPPLPAALPREATAWQKIAWVLYDWANSGYGLIITGPLFSPYFVGTLLPEQPSLPAGPGGQAAHGLMLGSTAVPATAVYGVLTALVALLVTLTAPVLGALADLRGWTKGLLVTTATAGSVFACTSYFLSPGRWLMGGIIYVVSAFFFATSLTFYNAYLPVLTAPEKQGRLSGWGFGIGYVGGAVALILAYIVVYQTLGFSFTAALAFGGVWWLAFSLPAFVLLPKVAPAAAGYDPTRSLVGQSFGRLMGTLRHIRQFRMLFLFLLAFLVYNNGIDTVINLSPAFGEDVLKMTEGELIRMFLIVQFVAFFGASIFGYVADKFGNKPVIVSNLVVWCVAVLGVAFVQTSGQFTVLGVLIGLVLGGVQSSSRALMSLLAPEEIRNEAFGFFSLSGKAISIFGPALFAVVATRFGVRTGVYAVLPFLVVGLILVLRVKEPRAR
ncbi:MAG TPA: MFS transporter [Tepidisphaeraceae bacterium]|nr:MFS transporter [Tepidisphaeraceae bacterium]